MLSVRIPEEIEAKINKLFGGDKRQKSRFVRNALYQMLEDMDDYIDAVAAMKEGGPTISLEEWGRELGLVPKDSKKSKKAA